METKKETCSICLGTKKGEDGEPCFLCKGKGYIPFTRIYPPESEKKWAIRRKRSDKVHAMLDGKASNRVILLIARAYLYGDLVKPLDELTDEELLAEPWVGVRTVKEIRAVIPSPGSKGV
ncbi:hypothetical protein LCGC14_1672920 [marine sediment metagenome]|uniref:Uncharacterized protein n=1 Tax=marine sediment metagenome TaxID=412755 RepID=A0A0F9K6L0_9ZZZZ